MKNSKKINLSDFDVNSLELENLDNSEIIIINGGDGITKAVFKAAGWFDQVCADALEIFHRLPTPRLITLLP